MEIVKENSDPQSMATTSGKILGLFWQRVSIISFLNFVVTVTLRHSNVTKVDTKTETKINIKVDINFDTKIDTNVDINFDIKLTLTLTLTLN